MSDSPVSLEGLFWDSTDDSAIKDTNSVTVNESDASRVTLPVEIVQEIMQLALDEYSPGMETARQMTTVAKSWVGISQRTLFRRITLGELVVSAENMDRQAARLRFLAGRPNLAAHVFEVVVYKYVVSEVESFALLAALPNVCTLEINEASFGLTRGKMSALVDVFPRLRTLLLRDHRPREDLVAPTVSTLTVLEISGYRVAAEYLDCLTASPMARSLRSARIQHLSLGATDFAQACKHVFCLQNLTALYLTIEDERQGVLLSGIPPVELPTHHQLTTLTLRLIITIDAMIPLLRALLSAANLPALRTLAIDVTFVQPFATRRVVVWHIPPFPVDVLRAPVLAASIARALASLRIRFTNARIESGDRANFFSLFGMEGRPGIADVVGMSISTSRLR